MKFSVLAICLLAVFVRHAASVEAERQHLQPVTTAVAEGGRSLKSYYSSYHQHDDKGDDEDDPEKYICTCTCEKKEEKKEGDKVVYYYYPGYYHNWCKHCRRMLHDPAAGGCRALRGYVYHNKHDKDNNDGKDEPTCECECELKEEEEEKEEDKVYTYYYKAEPKKKHRKYYKKSKCIKYGWVVKDQDR